MKTRDFDDRRIKALLDDSIDGLDQLDWEGAPQREFFKLMNKNPIDYAKVESNINWIKARLIEKSPLIDHLNFQINSDLTNWFDQVAKTLKADWVPPFLGGDVAAQLQVSFNESDLLIEQFPLSSIDIKLDFSKGFFNNQDGINYKGLGLASQTDSLAVKVNIETDSLSFLRQLFKAMDTHKICGGPKTIIEPEDLTYSDERSDAIEDSLCRMMNVLRSKDTFANILTRIKPELEYLQKFLDNLYTLAVTDLDFINEDNEFIQKYAKQLGQVFKFLTSSYIYNADTCEPKWTNPKGIYLKLIPGAQKACSPYLSIKLATGLVFTEADVFLIIKEDSAYLYFQGDIGLKWVTLMNDDSENPRPLVNTYIGLKMLELLNREEKNLIAHNIAASLEAIRTDLLKKLYDRRTLHYLFDSPEGRPLR